MLSPCTISDSGAYPALARFKALSKSLETSGSLLPEFFGAISLAVIGR